MFLIFNRFNSFDGVQNGKEEQPVCTRTAIGANKKLVLHMQLRCGSLSITTPVSLLGNEFSVWRKLHGQVSLAAVNQNLCSSWGYERLQKSKDSFKACFENVNITVCDQQMLIYSTLYSIISPFGAFEISCIWNYYENGAFALSMIFSKVFRT